MRDLNSVMNFKKVGVMGIARSGIAAAKKLKNLGLSVFLSDSSPKEKFTNLNEILTLGDCEFGEHTEKLLTNDLIIVSPGIAQDTPLLRKAKSMGITLWSEIELGYRLTHSDTKIIAVTGSNGKSTTSRLIAHILKAYGKDTILGGNIGDAYCSFDIENKHDFIVLEISSFQLDLIDKFHPNVSVLLNITPDHLDRYPSFDDYARSKFRITKNLNNEDLLVYNEDCKITNKLLDGHIHSKDAVHFSCENLLSFGLVDNDQNKKDMDDMNLVEDIIYLDATIVKDCIYFYNEDDYRFEPVVSKIDQLPLKGPHNHANILAALLSIKNYLDFKNIFDVLMSFQPLEHRLELVSIHNGVEYYNDSKATNTDSVKYALQSFTKPVHLILGGSDKGEDFKVLKPYIKENIKKIYLIGETANKLEEIFKDINYEKFTDFESVIKATINNAQNGEVVLLSPACASFDWFKNFEHRGKEFKRIVTQLTASN